MRALGFLGYVKYKIARWVAKPYITVRWHTARITFRPIKSDLETICEIAKGEYSKLNFQFQAVGYPEIIRCWSSIWAVRNRVFHKIPKSHRDCNRT